MRRSRTGFAILLVALGAAFAAFVALGVWQVRRLHWKEALIARVNARVSAPPSPAPGPAAWPSINRKSAEYRPVRLTGHFQPRADTLVLAVTDLGSGFWVLTPFETKRGFTVLVNRGYVDQRRSVPTPTGERTITGLLRITEPGGGFLRSNEPSENRWYSRDVSAIAATHGLKNVAPYFVDADRDQESGDAPVGGLTVIRFPNNHLGYAITWFALAVMTLFAAGVLIRERVRSQKA